ncbi:hypothetical protein AB0A95_30525 [Micromonospora sp. NPDC049230]|uniref:hypothetical protein n=1 Tax=Micromonospora sp. NPDC049230 TaxID=3155502 RepID=UPI0033C27493
MTAVASGRELERITLDSDGQWSYSTGAAQDIVMGRWAALGDKATDDEVFAALNGWTNGYIVIGPPGEAAADQPEG